MVISSFPDLKAMLHTLPPKPAVVAAAHDAHTLQAVFAARRDGLIRPILVGHREDILSIAGSLGEELDPDQVIDAEDDASCAGRSVALIQEGRGNILIKGMLQTGTLLKAVVHKESGIRASKVMSHVAILDVPSYHKLLYVTDGGMVVAPDLEQKRHILKNAVDFCRFLGYDRPKAATLCAVETVNPSMPETRDAAVLKEEAEHGDFGPCVVEGPISLDLATDAQAAQAKGYHSPVAGDADILLAPSIAAGNLLGKSLYGLAGGEMAGVVLGAAVPITVNSRGATAQEKYWSILICAAMN
ncbi:bifunctional enoyl-CoA hydratase/phosphate acetyltransferase [Pseudoflavonifractor sp. 60]|uniref:bifunctional enoyl-CoA hydratase/phosphate acetyltransferase n=1 Tax=Pseudoflavonifractor sp. 60 TaxID=2304576 RepID=UPI0013698E9E|nr:bifunctional enoyl-CoA hydratase/phosphate acetyltransferase [Pseudoflavonifractor sp. 60]NBI68063.1 bifunctional enoyl-CoA hydratase/phosphate acetyltransferase [Pseudoflavonifractor sp. 60]